MSGTSQYRKSAPRARWAVLVATCLGVSTLAVGSPSTAAEPESYGSVAQIDVEITMDDGVVLVGDVMYPADPATGERAGGDFPVLLSQTPYSCDSSATNSGFGDGSYFAENGYILASICVRGSGRSGGDFTLFGEREQLDGVGLVEWAAEGLDGTNGQVGLLGGSYLGLNQIFTQGRIGAETPVKAMIPACAGGEMYRETYFSGGMPTQTGKFPRNLGGSVGPRAGEFGRPLADEIEAGGAASYYGDFWTLRTPSQHAEAIADAGVPVLMWSSWDDIYAESAESFYAHLQNAYFDRPTYAPLEHGQQTTDLFQIIMSPGGHCAGIDKTIQREWMDTWIKGDDTRFSTADATPMHLYQQGSGTWINTAAYPMVRQYTPYYLGADGALSVDKPAVDDGSDALQYVQPAEADGSLTYRSAPLASGATLAGPISATVYASTTGTNINLITRLESVAPDGAVTVLSSGSLVGSLRELDESRSWTDDNGVPTRPYGVFEDDDYLDPGEWYELSVAMKPEVQQIQPGDALQLVVTTQMPADRCRGGLGTDPCIPTATQLATLPGTYQIGHDATNASAVNLPLLPFSCFAASGGSGAQASSFTGQPAVVSPCDGPTSNDKACPTVSLVEPAAAALAGGLALAVEAADDGGLSRIVANIYRDGAVVKSTQTPVGGAIVGRHTATVDLPDGAYTIKYNAQDLAGNISQTKTLAVTIDNMLPTATVKPESTGAEGVYSSVSFKLFDEGKIDKVVLNGVSKDLTDNTWSDLNGVEPGVLGGKLGENELKVYDVAGNVTVVIFTLVAAESAVESWSASVQYGSGDEVSYADAVYIAQWWTRGEEPGTATGSWMEQGVQVAAAGADVRAWTKSWVYTGGQTVAHDGHTWVAKWWTRNQEPGGANGPWKDLGAY